MSTPTPPPPPSAPRDEWREWRRQRRALGWGPGSYFWPLLLILAGLYFLLKNMGLLPFIREDIFWPSVLILVGLWLLLSRAVRSR